MASRKQTLLDENLLAPVCFQYSFLKLSINGKRKQLGLCAIYITESITNLCRHDTGCGCGCVGGFNQNTLHNIRDHVLASNHSTDREKNR